jgi:putative hydroxymethylpyrimidine transport system ATP-binding protein
MLHISHLTKKFDRLSVLDDFGLDVRQNGFTVLIGPSGCGKSTLFDVLTGMVKKDAGHVSWMGQTLSHLAGQAAYMQQKDLLLPWFSLLENGLLPAKIAGADLGFAKDKAMAFFDRLGLAGFESYRPHQVSGGMRQRCALARTLMFHHELVLLDEPLSALDAITRYSLQDLLLMLQTEFKKTILMITHDVEEALLLADEVLVLSSPPMRIVEKLSLKTPKPRKIDDPDLAATKARILARLKKELTLETR